MTRTGQDNWRQTAAYTNEQWIPNYLYGQKEVGLGFTLIIYGRDSVLLQQVRRPFDIFICFPFPAAQPKFRVQQMKSTMATSRRCVWISNFEYNKSRALWQQADAVFEFQIPSTTNEEQYGNKQTLCLNFKFRVQQMKSNMEKIFCSCFCFYP